MIISIFTLCFTGFALAFEISRPMVSNIYFVNDKLGAVVVVNNDNHFPKAMINDPYFFRLNLFNSNSEKISKPVFTSEFLKESGKVNIFNERDFIFTNTPYNQTLTSRSGGVYEIKNSKCIVLNDLYAKCKELEVVFDKYKENIKLPNDVKPNLTITSIEKFGDHLLLGAGTEGELELHSYGLFAYNLKTKTLVELTMFANHYITLLKVDKNLSHIWIAGSLGVHKLDKDLKVIKACPLIFKEGKENEATLVCTN